MRKNLQTYRQVNVESAILASDPHKIILMMLDGAMMSLAEAKGAIERNDLEAKSKEFTKAINILSALRDSLDNESEPEISENFDNLYSYCIDRLVDLSVSLDLSGLDEIITFIRPLRDAWSQMPEEAKQEGISRINDRNLQQDCVAAGS